MKKIALIIVLLSIPFSLSAAEFTHDLGIANSDISFSEPMDHLVEKQPVRIYAKIKNYGTEDVAASVIFFSGVNLVGETQPVSVRADGLADEVYVDWVVPSGAFNIMAEIKNPDPADEDLTNNRGLTTLITPLLDGDGDGIPDIEDDDFDNDGVTNDEEQAQGTDPINSDSDNDGVGDADDFYPTDSTKTEEEVEEEEQVVQEDEQTSEEEVTEPETINQGDELVSNDDESEIKNIEEEDEELEKEFETEAYQKLQTMPGFDLINNVEVVVEQIGWGKYNFDFLTNEEGFDTGALIYEWSFGDGKKSKENGEHTYNRAGTYFVKLKVLGPFGNTVSDVATINVPFWAIENYAMWGGGVFLLIALIVLIFSGKKPRPTIK